MQRPLDSRELWSLQRRSIVWPFKPQPRPSLVVACVWVGSRLSRPDAPLKR